MNNLFNEKKTNNGWILNIFKNNEIVLTTSLYDDGGTFIESRGFKLNQNKDIESLKRYVDLFEGSSDLQKDLHKFYNFKF